MMVLLRGCESEWNSSYHYFPSVTFVVLTGDQFVGRDDGPLEQQKQDSHVCQMNRIFPLILRKIRVITTNKGGKFLKKLWCCVGGSIAR